VSPADQIVWLLVLALPVACVSWTVTKEEIFREPRDCAADLCQTGPWWKRKFFYVFTCEYCFSHYVSLGFLALTGFRLLLDDWRGVVLAWFALVAVANVYMSAYTRLRVEIRKERAEADLRKAALDDGEAAGDGPPDTERMSHR
jgi:hypothetical protein